MNPSPFPDYMRPAMTFLDVMADYLLLAGGLGALVFIVLYSGFMDWRATPAGRAILAFMVSLVSVLGLILASRFTGGDYPFRDVLRLVLYGAVFVTSWRLVFVLISAWREDARGLVIEKRERHRTGPTPTQKP